MHLGGLMERVRGHLTYANVTATLALFLALTGGVAWAMQANSVRSKHIANGQVKSADVKDDGLKGADIQESALDLSDALPNAVVFYDGPCPGGWSDFTAAEGRYMVGVPAGGTVGLSVGTALTDGQNRAVSGHVHTTYDNAHAHDPYYEWGFADTPDSGTTRRPIFDFKPPDVHGRPDVPIMFAWPGASFNTSMTGTGTGTNAPYIQLRACRPSP